MYATVEAFKTGLEIRILSHNLPTLYGFYNVRVITLIIIISSLNINTLTFRRLVNLEKARLLMLIDWDEVLVDYRVRNIPIRCKNEVQRVPFERVVGVQLL